MQRHEHETLPEYIRRWVEREYPPRYVERVTDGLIDVAAGNRRGNSHEVSALRALGVLER